MVAVERLWQGDRNARIRLDKEPWGASKIFKKAMTHISWLLIAAATGGAFVLYFHNAPTHVLRVSSAARRPRHLSLLRAVHRIHLPLRRHRARAGLHLHVPLAAHPGRDVRCRFAARHLSRLPRRAARPAQQGQSWEGAATASTARPASPCARWASTSATALSSNASRARCASTLATKSWTKMGRPRGLIAYDTFRSVESEKKGGGIKLKLLRPRTLLYLGLITAVSALMLAAIGMRSVLDLNAVADRNPLYVTLSDGGIRNTFTLKDPEQALRHTHLHPGDRGPGRCQADDPRHGEGPRAEDRRRAG